MVVGPATRQGQSDNSLTQQPTIMRKYIKTALLNMALILSAKKILLCSPAAGYLFYFKFVHLSTQQSKDKKHNIYLKDVILALSWGA